MTRRVAVRFATIVLTVLALDQLTKSLVRARLAVGESVPVIDGILSLTHVRNAGAAFGLLQGGRAFFIAAASIVIVGILWALWRLRIRTPLLTAALGLAFGGALGNLIDRIVAGRVTDFFDIHIWPVFNVADIALDVGVALLVVDLLFVRDAENGLMATLENGSGPQGRDPGVCDEAAEVVDGSDEDASSDGAVTVR